MKRCIPFALTYNHAPACERRWAFMERCRAHFEIEWPSPFPLDPDLISVRARDTALRGFGTPLWALLEDAYRRLKADEAWTLRSDRIRDGLKRKAAREKAAEEARRRVGPPPIRASKLNSYCQTPHGRTDTIKGAR